MSDALSMTGAAPSPPTDLEQRLAAAKAQRDAIAKSKAAREAEAAIAKQVAEEELALLNEQAIEKFTTEIGEVGDKIGTVFTRRGVIIVKKPNHVLFQRWQDVGKTTTTAAMTLVRPCVVYPDLVSFDAWMQDQPGVLAFLADECCILAGIRIEEARGK